MPVKRKTTFDQILLAIGKKIKTLRHEKGFKSAAEFAATYNLAPIQYWRIENGRANITLKSLNNILKIHGVSVAELFTYGLSTRASARKSGKKKTAMRKVRSPK